LDAHAEVRDAVHGHHAVRAVARAAEEPTRPVVLERAREQTTAGGEERRADRVALIALELPGAEAERDRFAPIDQLARLRWQSHGCVGSGRKVSRTSFVRV